MTPEVVKNRESLVNLLTKNGWDVKVDELAKKLEGDGYTTKLWSSLINDETTKKDLFSFAPNIATFNSLLLGTPPSGQKKNQGTPQQVPKTSGQPIGTTSTPTEQTGVPAKQDSKQTTIAWFREKYDKASKADNVAQPFYQIGPDGQPIRNWQEKGDAPMADGKVLTMEEFAASSGEKSTFTPGQPWNPRTPKEKKPATISGAVISQTASVLDEFKKTPEFASILKNTSEELPNLIFKTKLGKEEVDRVKLRTLLNKRLNAADKSFDPNSDFAKDIFNAVHNELTYKITSDKIVADANASFLKKTGKTPEQAFEELKTEPQRVFDLNVKPIIDQFKVDKGILESRFNGLATELDNAFKQVADEIDDRYMSRSFIRGKLANLSPDIDRDAYLQAEYQREMDEAHKKYKGERSKVSADMRKESERFKATVDKTLKETADKFVAPDAKDSETYALYQQTIFNSANKILANDAAAIDRKNAIADRQWYLVDKVFKPLETLSRLTRSLDSGTAIVLSSMATWLSSEVSANWTTRLADMGMDRAANIKLPSNPLETFGDLLNPMKVAQNLGEQLPNMAATIGTTLLTRRPIGALLGRGAMGIGLKTVAGAGMATLTETAIRKGSVIQELMQQGVSMADADKRSDIVWKSYGISLMVNALQWEAVFGKFGKGSFLARFGAGGATELGTEIPQEIIQTREEEAASLTPESQRATALSVGLNVAPTSIIMALPGSAVQSSISKETFAPAWMNRIKNYPITLIAEQINNSNINLVKAGIEFQSFNGLISPVNMEQLGVIADNIQIHLNEAKENGLNKHAQVDYVTLVSTAEDIRNQIATAVANGAAPEQVAALEQKHANAAEAAKNLLSQKSGNYAVITAKSGERMIVTHDALTDLLETQEFQENVKNGDVNVEVRSTKKKTKLVSPLREKLYDLNRRFDQPTAVYENEETNLKALRSRLGVNPATPKKPKEYTVPGMVGQEVNFTSGPFDITGELRVEGQTLVIENEDTIYEVGSLKDLKKVKPASIGISLVQPEVEPEGTPVLTEEEASIPSIISMYAGKISPEALVDTIMSVVPTADRNVILADVYAWDNAYRQTNARTEAAADTDGDKRSPSKIEPPSLEVGKDYDGKDVAEVVAELGDKDSTTAIDKMREIGKHSFIGQEIDLDELYANDPAFAARVEAERTAKNPRVDQSKEKYFGPQNAPAIIVNGNVVDGYGRLAQKYLNGDKTAKAFTSNGASTATIQTALDNAGIDTQIDDVYNEVFGSESFGTPATLEELKAQAANANRLMTDLGFGEIVIVHDTQESYLAAVPNGANSRGFFDAVSEGGKVKPLAIHINGAKALNTTVAHEVAHAVLLTKFGDDPALFIEFKYKVAGILKSSNNKALEQFSNAYDQAVSAEEYLAELTGALKAGEADMSILSKLGALINDVVSYITNGSLVPFSKISEGKEVLNFLSSIADAVNGKAGALDMDGNPLSSQDGGITREQSVSVMRGTESMKKFGLNPDKNNTVIVGQALEDRQRAKYGVIDRNDRSEESKRKIGNWMVEEVKYFIETMGEQSGKGWYGEKYQKGINNMAAVFPELATDQNARDLFTMLVAVTSDGQGVLSNFQLASTAYSFYKQNDGVLPEVLPGAVRQNSLTASFKKINALLKENNKDIQAIKEKLLTVTTIRQLNKERKKEGLESIKSDWPVDFNAPLAASILSPKLGMFYANLSGQENYPTLDRWWSRTFNRYRGTVRERANRGFDSKGKPIGLDLLKVTLGDPSMSDDQALVEATRLRNSYKAKDYKNGTVAEVASNTLYKAEYENLIDIPFNATDRLFMYDTIKGAVDKLNKQGYDLSIADVQAILWYYEKNLYKTLGVRANIKGISYEEAASITIEKFRNANNSFDYEITKEEEDEDSIIDEDDEAAEEAKIIKKAVKRAQIIGQIGAAAADISDGLGRMEGLAQAKKMDGKLEPRKILAATGWQMGGDGKWRYEVSDDKVKIDIGKLNRYDISSDEKLTLGDIMDHPELYQSYPELKNVRVKIKESSDFVMGSFELFGQDITLNRSLLDSTSYKTTILHEVQHYVQLKEGFELIANQDINAMMYFRPDVLEVGEDSLNQSVNQISELIAQGRTLRDISEMNDDDVSDIVNYFFSEEQINNNEFDPEIFINQVEDHIEFEDNERHDLYIRNASEVEARNVERRSDMDSIARRTLLLKDTQDVAQEDVIYFDDWVDRVTREQKNLMHGTAYQFDKFNLNKVGKGSGAATYGHGVYFTDTRSIAEHYGNEVGLKHGLKFTLSNGIDLKPMVPWIIEDDFNNLMLANQPNSKAELVDLIDEQFKVAKFRLDMMDKKFGKKKDSAMKKIFDNSYMEAKTKAESYMDLLKDVKKVEGNPEIRQEFDRYIYNVAIHKGKTPDQYDYLDLNGRVTSPQVDKINKQLAIEGIKPSAFWVEDTYTGQIIYDRLQELLGSDVKASDFLLSAGIDGNTYQSDYGQNYVVFNPESIDIENVERFAKSDIDRFIDGLRARGVSDKIIEGALVKKLGLNPDQASKAMVNNVNPTPPQTPEPTPAELVKIALKELKRGMPASDVWQMIDNMGQGKVDVDQIMDVATNLNVTSKQGEDKELSKEKIDNALNVPEVKRPGFFSRIWDKFSNLSVYLDNPNRYITKIQRDVESYYDTKLSRIPLGRLFEKNASGRAIFRTKEFLDGVIKGLSKKEILDFERYLFVKRIIDRNEQDEINKTFNPNAASRATGGITLQDGVTELEDMKNRLGTAKIMDFESRAEAFQKFADQNLQLLVAAGLLSQDTYDSIKSQNDFYAPFSVVQNLFPQGDPNERPAGMANQIMKITGIDINGDFDLDVIKQLKDQLDQGTINKDRFYQLAVTALDVLQQSGGISNQEYANEMGKIADAGFAVNKIIDRMAAVIFDSVVNAAKNDKMRMLYDIANTDTEGLFVKRVPGAVDLNSIKNEEGFSAVKLKVDGENVFLSINKGAADTLNNTSTAKLTGLMKGVNFVNSWFRLGVITLSPSFMYANFVIDFMRTAAISKYGLLSGKDFGDRLANVALFVPQYIEGLISAGLANTGIYQNELFEKFMQSDAYSAGIFDNPFANNEGTRALSIRSASGFSKFVNGMKHLVDIFGRTLEQSHKLVALERGLDESGTRVGLSKLKNLLYEAKTPAQLQEVIDRVNYEVQNFAGSPNFPAIGKEMKYMNAIFQFFGARLKGEMTDFRRIGQIAGLGSEGVRMTKNERAQMVLQTGSVVSMIIAYAMRNHADDEEEKEFYTSSPYDRDNNINIPYGTFLYTDDAGNQTKHTEYIRIPVRGFLQNINVIANSYMKFRKAQNKEEFVNGVVRTLGNALPITISGDTYDELIESVFSNTTPIIKGPIEVGTNRNTFLHTELERTKYGVYPVRQMMKDEILRPDLFLWKNKRTPEWAKELSTYLYEKDLMRITPVVLDHLENTFAGNITDMFKNNPIKRRMFRSESNTPVWKDRN
jgi:hypothetical protein